MDRSNLAYADKHVVIEPGIECVFFDETGAVEETFTAPLKKYSDPLRFGLADDFIGPPLHPSMHG